MDPTDMAQLLGREWWWWWWWFDFEILRYQKEIKEKSPGTEQDTAQCSLLILSCPQESLREVFINWNYSYLFTYLLFILCVCMWVEVRGQRVGL